MTIGITGATGFIGSRLISLARERGADVIGFSRSPSRPIEGCRETRDFSRETPLDLSGCETIVHLAGEPVAGLWTRKKQAAIMDSRHLGTRRLVDSIGTNGRTPRVLVSCSAVGYYGDTGETGVDEGSAPGTGFLAEVVQRWEAEALRARQKGVRVVLLRMAIVLGKGGGALRIIGPLFRSGLGGKLGSGNQWMTWVHLDDAAGLALFAAENDAVDGPINVASPQPSRNSEFTHALATVLRRPQLLRTPAFVLRAALGKFANELLANKRVLPKKALEHKYRFRHADLTGALHDIFTPANLRV